jgi:putative two-component system response regulator
VAVADVFDALTSVRPYKPAWTVEAAVAELKRGSGSHFQPRVVEAFLARLEDILAVTAAYRD